MTDDFTLRYKVLKRELSLRWLIIQFRHRRYRETPQEIQDVYLGKITGDTAKPILDKALSIIDDYDLWMEGTA